MPTQVKPLRLLADDLTGALDSAAAFAAPSAPVPVRWCGAVPETGAVAWDSGTREASAEDAQSAIDAVASRLMAGPDGLAFKKIDSLLRGNEAVEIACLLQRLRARHCIIAPAFPAQGRITRGGRQHVWAGDKFKPVPSDLQLALSDLGLPVAIGQLGEVVPPGASIWDAQNDEDLDAVVAMAADLPDVLWVGSAGLAAALARTASVNDHTPSAALARPILGLVGSDHDVTRAQLGHIARYHIEIEPRTSQSSEHIQLILQSKGAVFVTVALPAGMARHDATATIRSGLQRVLEGVERPGTLIVTGGETLRSVCEALGADQLDVLGYVVPGVPHAKLRGGRWDNVDIVSKSGAFGTPEFLEQLVMNKIQKTVGAAP